MRWWGVPSQRSLTKLPQLHAQALLWSEQPRARAAPLLPLPCAALRPRAVDASLLLRVAVLLRPPAPLVPLAGGAAPLPAGVALRLRVGGSLPLRRRGVGARVQRHLPGVR